MSEEVEDNEEGNLESTQVEGVDVIHHCFCPSCGEGSGITRMLLHKIPFFREVVIVSFACENCGERNNEVSFGGEIQLQGSKQTLVVKTASDLDRQLVKSDSASLFIPELEFEIPAGTQKGEINTIEGFLRTAAKNLGVMQREREELTPEVGERVARVIITLSRFASGDTSALPFHIILDDPAGNSYIQNPNAPVSDPQLQCSFYKRSQAQDEALGLNHETADYRDPNETNFIDLASGSFGKETEVDEGAAIVNDVGRKDVIAIPSPCPSCFQDGQALTAVTDIPHFKEVIIMAFTCEFCGFRNNEVKGGGSIPSMGTEVSLTVTGPNDLKRDILKSDSCSVQIPEIELELQHGTLGGVYTTVEGLIVKIYNSLENSNPFAIGDAATLHHSNMTEVSGMKAKFHEFTAKLQELIAGKRFPFQLVLRDPLGNSFISAPLGSFLPPELDQNLRMVDFERSFEENDEFGLNDINTRDFETGVNNDEYYNNILADRLTHVVPVGPDHPTLYAKGTYDHDDTPGSIPLPVATVENKKERDDDSNYYQGPDGWKFERVSSSAGVSAIQSSNELPWEGYDKRRFDEERDSKLKFLMYENFSGRKEGFVFRLGSQGLGYYEDIPII